MFVRLFCLPTKFWLCFALRHASINLARAVVRPLSYHLPMNDIVVLGLQGCCQAIVNDVQFTAFGPVRVDTGLNLIVYTATYYTVNFLMCEQTCYTAAQ